MPTIRGVHPSEAMMHFPMFQMPPNIRHLFQLLATNFSFATSLLWALYVEISRLRLRRVQQIYVSSLQIRLLNLFSVKFVYDVRSRTFYMLIGLRRANQWRAEAVGCPGPTRFWNALENILYSSRKIYDDLVLVVHLNFLLFSHQLSNFTRIRSLDSPQCCIMSR